jgi:hypothetical protein
LDTCNGCNVDQQVRIVKLGCENAQEMFLSKIKERFNGITQKCHSIRTKLQLKAMNAMI